MSTARKASRGTARAQVAPPGTTLLTVARLIPADVLRPDRRPGLLATVRRLVGEIRRDQGLARYRLYDVGFVRRGDHLEVRLYLYR